MKENEVKIRDNKRYATKYTGKKGKKRKGGLRLKVLRKKENYCVVPWEGRVCGPCE